MSSMKRRGTGWETAIVDYLRTQGFPYTERRALAGKADRGDIAGLPGVVIEAKNQARFDISEWLNEAETEKANDGAWLGVVWAKKRGKSSAGDGYVVMTGAQFAELLRIVTETSNAA